MSAEEENDFPPGTTALESQVAGHAFNDSKTRIGLLVKENGYVLKPIEGPVRGKREVNFYREIQKSTDPTYQKLKTFIPDFYGTQKLPWNGQEVDYIVLSNATAGMAQPCVMDIKIGKQTWDPEAPPSKKEKELKKYPESKRVYGFCIPGLQMYDIETGQLIRHGKEFGKDLDGDSTKEVFKTFFNLKSERGRPIIESLLVRLRDILSWCQNQRQFLMYSSSLLLAYDASELTKAVGDNTKILATLTMIDFAHVFPSNGQPDFNYTDGVENLVKLFEVLLLET